MLTVTAGDVEGMRPFFAPERPGPMVFGHVATTGRGIVAVDRWPGPRVAMAQVGQDTALRGDPDHLSPDAFAGAAAFLEAPPQWEAALRNIDPALAVWPRIIATLPAGAHLPVSDAVLLGPDDVPGLAALPADIAWIHETWGGPEGLALARVARGYRVDDELVAVAGPFHIGSAFEDVGVVTAAAHRGHGRALSCAAAVLQDIRDRGRVPSWSTSPDNPGSLAVAARLGFVHHRDDVLYAINLPSPDDSH